VYFQGTDDKLWRFFQPLQELKRLVQKQPDRILEIQYTNPDHPQDVSALYVQNVAFAGQNPTALIGGHFPSPDAEQEWKQVLPLDLTDTAGHNADHEGPNLVGATGWVLHPECSKADVAFDHPFGFDWEFMLALDRPAADPKRYTFLLTPANQTFAEDGYPEAVEEAAKMTGEIQEADSLRDPPVPNADRVIIPPGPDGLDSVLGVEIDGGLVPQQFIEGVRSGDRLAIFGRWIVDCGHQKPITRAPADPNAHPEGDDIHPGLTAFRTEIHPPLLMAAARLTSGSIASGTTQGGQSTRVLFTSRPYLVGQRFTTNTDTIWDDSDPGDGPFFSHFVEEVKKVNDTLLGIIPLGSTQVEAHPKIRSKPFQGAYTAHFVVRSPFVPVGAHHSVPPAHIVVSFQFTVRTGCGVQVTSSGPDSVDIIITMDSESYKPPTPLNRRERTWTRDELVELDPSANDGYLDALKLSAVIQATGFTTHSGIPGGALGFAEAFAVLGRGIKTDEYDIDEIRNVNLLDASRAVTASGDSIPPGQGVIVNDDQPFPVSGWLEITPVIPPEFIDLNNPVTPVG